MRWGEVRWRTGGGCAVGVPPSPTFCRLHRPWSGGRRWARARTPPPTPATAGARNLRRASVQVTRRATQKQGRGWRARCPRRVLRSAAPTQIQRVPTSIPLPRHHPHPRRRTAPRPGAHHIDLAVHVACSVPLSVWLEIWEVNKALRATLIIHSAAACKVFYSLLIAHLYNS